MSTIRITLIRGVALAWLATTIASVAACASNSAPAIRAGLGENFQLRVGQSAIIDTVALEVRFETVSADSRCAQGDTCVWEGDAIVRLWLQQPGSQRETVDLHTAGRSQSSAVFDGYDVSLVALGPIPVSGGTIALSEYILTLKVTAGDVGRAASTWR